MKSCALLAVAFLIIAPLCGQDQARREWSAEQLRKIREQISDPYLSGPKLEAGRTGDRSFVPLLRDALQKTRYRDAMVAAHLALAKLGEGDHLGIVSCELQSANPVERYDATDKLGYIGGWFSVFQLSRFLDDENLEAKRKFVDADVTVPSLVEIAVLVLPHIVPDPPVVAPSRLRIQLGDVQPEVDIWKSWIASNEALLRKLEPNNDIKPMSSARCKELLQRLPWNRQEADGKEVPGESCISTESDDDAEKVDCSHPEQQVKTGAHEAGHAAEALPPNKPVPPR